ncbi:serine kinase [Novosphingobium sp. FSY-8]|uniref:Serine kinase n=1 Tax=Novosphingobium ovatum TaxID=1908523 RepID=A0ABW9XAY2_9SPHN|nr:HPr kinase/phosphatase C-terminal domain-containing protein [Novosphingobium ovatum]NBC35688.1 serine kinase [Novosphingobium ovatum]
MSPPVPHQASCVVIGGRAVLIEGPPGIGKSSLALGLMDRGAVLVGDDGILLQPDGDGLIALPHPRTRGLIEVRNLGLLPMPVCDRAPVALVLRLDVLAPRFIESAPITTLHGVPLPVIRLWPDSPVLALRAEMALAHHGLPLRQVT